jgi:hypothetical protein
MFVVGITAVGIMAGLKGLFWTLFWGAAAWFVSKGLISFLTRRKKINIALPSAKR